MSEIAQEIKNALHEVIGQVALSMIDCKLLTAQQVMALLEIKDDTFLKIRTTSGFPAPVMVGEGDKCRRWKKADIEAWIDSGGHQQKPRVGRKRVKSTNLTCGQSQ